MQKEDSTHREVRKKVEEADRNECGDAMRQKILEPFIHVLANLSLENGQCSSEVHDNIECTFKQFYIEELCIHQK